MVDSFSVLIKYRTVSGENKSRKYNFSDYIAAHEFYRRMIASLTMYQVDLCNGNHVIYTCNLNYEYSRSGENCPVCTVQGTIF